MACTIIAHAGGELFGLDANVGKILWHNRLHGLGYGHCIIAAAGSGLTTSQQTIQTAVHHDAQRANDGGAMGD